MIDPWTVGTILMMALATYLTRIGGYLVLGGRALSPRVMTMLDTAPGCVLIAVIAPVFASGRPADLIALAITVVAAMRLSLLPAVLTAVAAGGLARYVLG